MRGEELFDLLKQDTGLHRLDQQLVGAAILPVLVVDGKGGQKGDGRLIGGGAGGGDDLFPGGLVLHAHISDDHVVLASAQLRLALTRGGGGIDVEPADLEHRLQRQQHRNLIIDKQNPAFHACSSFSVLLLCRPGIKAQRFSSCPSPAMLSN